MATLRAYSSFGFFIDGSLVLSSFTHQPSFLVRFSNGLSFVCRFVDRKDFEYVEMDTDSAYMALSGSMDSVIKPTMRRTFYDEYEQWFPRPFCQRHKDDFIALKMTNPDSVWDAGSCCKQTYNYDMRTPGLFKEEFKGSGIIALNSKTYYCWNDDDDKTVKYSSKGLLSFRPFEGEI